MKFQDIVEEWTEDATIDINDISEEIRRMPKLHAKYLGYYVAYRAKVKQLDHQLIKLRRERTDYYTGRSEKASAIRILKTEAPAYAAADDDVQSLDSKLEHARIAVSYLERVLKMIESRGFELKTALEWHRFSSGGR
jgi:hypothetical protein